MKYLTIVIIATIWSCKPSYQTPKTDLQAYKFAILEDEPIFEDEYLFEKEEKKCLVERINDINFYHCDWNNNGNYKEIGIDYVGIKSKLENKPTLVKIDSTNHININGQNYIYKSTDITNKLVETKTKQNSILNLVTKLSPILLENGEYFLPETNSDSTVIYFWATWCRPCVETLKNIDFQKLEKSNITLIPIAYNCSKSANFIKKNKLKFQDLIISEKSALDYNIKSLSKQYTFLKNGEISNKNVNLKKYYH